MKKRITLFFAISILVVFQGCTEKSETMISKNPNITADNISVQIAKQITH